MSLEKLVNIRQRLSQLTETESESATGKSDREVRSEKELMAVIQALDELIGEYKSEWLINTNKERELQRTTGRPLPPPTQPQPHEIKWQGPNPGHGTGGNIIG